MKIKNMNLEKEPKNLKTVSVYLASSGTCRWQGPFIFVLDTGASRSSITQDLADQIGFEPLPDEAVILGADNKRIKVTLAAFDILPIIGPRPQCTAFTNSVMCVKQSGENMLGLDILDSLDFSILKGKVRFAL